ncbi:alkaline phosphatase [Fulvivirga ligni]|uniref:alkaline phosphatase n=1 Tax=Fulvivirga ligni TaxID=2904246 RepID=UPI001F42B90F|nr:alkaline phosphatase [Fulvivirga ligni]UII22841.1 alkaline phosphatase [Fulvivirga ligni]
MRKTVLTLFFLSLMFMLKAQKYPTSSIFAHNDYHRSVPLYIAYQQRVGFIEADVFLRDDQLLVAHSTDEIQANRTLESLYLKPLNDIISRNKGLAYHDSQQKLMLFIDLKNDGYNALKAIVAEVEKYPILINCPTFGIAVSGDMPSTEVWDEFPKFIEFDGRTHLQYTPEQLERVPMISMGLGNLTQWNGKGVLTKEDESKVKAIIDQVHKLGKPIRFWGTPDFTNAWIEFRKLGVDILNTDKVQEAAEFLNGAEKNYYQNTERHSVYEPQHAFKRKNPKNVILLIGDGTGLSQWYAGYTANGGALNVFQIKSLGYAVTNASDSYITDSAAGATAMATGKKTNNRYIGMDADGHRLTSITEILKDEGFNTAIISSGDITDATPASFYAHQKERSLSEAIALDFLKSKNDILIGGGYDHFIKRSDEKNLKKELEKAGYFVSDNFQAMDGSHQKMVILDEAAKASMQNGRGDFLTQALTKSIQALQKTSQPFFIMEESAQVDWGGHSNDLPYVVQEVLDLDKTIGEAMKFVDQNQETLLIITADHETGGLSLVGGDLQQGAVRSHFSTNDHTGVMVPVFAYGPGAENFQGVYANTEIFTKILGVLKLSSQ